MNNKLVTWDKEYLYDLHNLHPPVSTNQTLNEGKVRIKAQMNIGIQLPRTHLLLRIKLLVFRSFL